ncbi:MAG: hybrid sensor histidine kinase/response regulator [Magnetococcales bacterium]|nr:hybrid sensor histidine kinase/response regulator [Magnetococcales bacterium]
MNAVLGKKRILIVDDAQENVAVLRQILTGCVRLVALDGMQALAIAHAEPPPDLILLDIVMPGLDGYETCRRLKADDKTRSIPVIFLTAKSSVEDEAKGLALGAVDYITKPISPPVVLARVATHLAMHDAYQQLQQQYAALQEMETLRKDVEAITRHDLKSPVNGILGCAELLLADDSLSRVELRQFHQLIRDAARQLREMINLSLNLLKMEQGQYAAALQPIDLLPIIHRIRLDNQSLLNRKKLATILRVNGQPEPAQARFLVLGDETLCYTMIANLYKNALEASEEGQTVTLDLDQGEMAAIAIHNAGVVPEQIRACFFKKYATFGKKGGTGLGSYSARLMAQTQQGDIQWESSAEHGGTTLTILLHKATEV